MAIGEPGLGNPKYRLVFNEINKKYRIQKRCLYFWYILLPERFEEHELYQARIRLSWLRQAEIIRKTKERYIILDD